MAGGEAKKPKDDVDAIRHDGGEKRGWAGETYEDQRDAAYRLFRGKNGQTMEVGRPRSSAYGQRIREQGPRVDSERVNDHGGAMKAPGPNMRTRIPPIIRFKVCLILIVGLES